jgi:hypothetical protein
VLYLTKEVLRELGSCSWLPVSQIRIDFLGKMARPA